MVRSGAEVIPHPSSSAFDLRGPTGRLAELVAHLCACPGAIAVEAVERACGSGPGVPGPGVEPEAVDERLEVVAKAMVLLRHDQQRRHRRPA